MKYKVVRADFLDKLTEEVNEHISRGWKPLGGICVHYYEISKLPECGWTDHGGDHRILHEFMQSMVIG